MHQELPDPFQSATAGKLIRAAAKEFNRYGFGGTDSNKIARRAGFAPQTFYRWFQDKTDIFLAVYRAWEEEERSLLAHLLAEKAPTDQLVDAIVRHHRVYRIFRRSLRQLSLQDPVVRKARAESRTRQIGRIRASLGAVAPDASETATILFQIERLCDGIADEEFADLGADEKPARVAVANLLDRLRR
ncbi:MAG: TetR/AcrR family transcriptional regulator [Deltaproteobacteria bacterium]|jgi:AcrR family transcriptional regulator|nr:TetR/AcrR family transcriptional regulator [Deltaproteobacteria bacterium]